MSRAARKRARPVLRGPRRGNAPGLPDEVYFSVIQRKLLTPDDFEDLDELATQILAFDKHYNAAARPFDWKFTRTDLNRPSGTHQAARPARTAPVGRMTPTN